MLPLAEESDSQANEELFSMSDVRIEVMRARGAGGQVCERVRQVGAAI